MNQVNPSRYRAFSEPFESQETAAKAANDFLKEVSILREKYKLPDVSIIIHTNCLVDGEETGVGSGAYFGDSAKEVVILATAYSVARRDWENKLNRISGEIFKK